MMSVNSIEVSFSPAVFHKYENKEAIVVVVDILRATTSIVTAFINGVNKIIPVGTLDEAKSYKTQGYTVAAERDGIKRDFADFGNSPGNFSKENVQGKDIVYSTTNGTHTIHMASSCHQVLIGAYLNISSIENYLVKANRPVVILCAGWKSRFNLEDTLFAGALAEKLLTHRNYSTDCDSTHAAIDLWSIAQPDLLKYIEKAAQFGRLTKNRLHDAIPYSHQIDTTDVIPVLENNYLINGKLI